MLSISRNAMLISMLILLNSVLFVGNFSLGSNDKVALEDSKLKVELVASGLKAPTSMAFLAKDDILILEKNGIVHRVFGNNILKQPVLDISTIVNDTRERGLLGISIPDPKLNNSRNDTNGETTEIYLYFTREIPKNANKFCGANGCENDQRIVNSLYRYDVKYGKLVNPKLLINIPGGSDDIGIEHIGGAITTGSDGRIYITSGDSYPCRSIEDCKNSLTNGTLNSKTANSINGSNPSGLGGILAVPQEFDFVNDGNLSEGFPSNLYYAYGIRNSFGLDFDPVTGNLWDTENGPYFGDEINLVKKGFNSGWAKIQGIWPITNYSLAVKDLPEGHLFPKINSVTNPNTLYEFNNGTYDSPKFSWNNSVGVTAIKFYNSDKMGRNYYNDIFVGSYSKGFLYHFDLNKDRTDLLTGNLENNVASRDQLKPFIFGRGFYGVSDVDVSPDGLLYILSYTEGKLWRIMPAE